MPSFVVHLVSLLLGLYLVGATLFSAVETFVLPRAAPDLLSRIVFRTMRYIFDLRLRRTNVYNVRDGVMAFYAPVGLLALLPAWLTLILLGYSGVFWGLGVGTWYDAFKLSGSSLFTLGFASADSLIFMVLTFSEATIGLILVALLIAYLPTMYAAFSRRETAVTLLEVRAGTPPTPLEMLLRFHRIHGLDQLTEQWRTWEAWFADIEESHTSLAALVFFRSPQPSHSWITAAGAILDAASLSMAAIDRPPDPAAALCVRAGFLALRRISDFFNIRYDPNPRFPDPISVTRAEFDAVCDQLAADGVAVKADREAAWRAYAGWRVNYDTVLVALARMTMAPPAPWSSDRIGLPLVPALEPPAEQTDPA